MMINDFWCFTIICLVKLLWKQHWRQKFPTLAPWEPHRSPGAGQKQLFDESDHLVLVCHMFVCCLLDGSDMFINVYHVSGQILKNMFACSACSLTRTYKDASWRLSDNDTRVTGECSSNTMSYCLGPCCLSKGCTPTIAFLKGENHEESWEFRVFPFNIKQIHIYIYIIYICIII